MAEISRQADAVHRTRTPLSRQRVLSAAVALADEGGVDALSMRKLAQELGVVPMALYKHVAHKNELLDGMIDVLVGEIDPPVADTDWKTAVRLRVLSARRMLLRHPWASGIIEARMKARAAPTPAVLAYLDSMIGILRAGGFSVGLVHHAMHVMGSRLLGFSQELFDDAPGREPDPDGDEVLGFCTGAFAEYACTTEGMLVRKPAALTFEQAAALPMGAVTALRGIRTVGRVGEGQRVLVNGAGGGVGTCAVQIAVSLGAEVTAVCGAGNAGLVRSLGAAHVVDYTREDFTAAGARYDVVLDNVGNHPTGRLRRTLTPTGTLVANAGGSPGRVFGAMGATLKLLAAGALARQRLRVILPAVPSGPVREDLRDVVALVEAGRLTPVVGRTLPLAEAAAGMRLVEEGHARGKVVLTVG
ncbi:zinc-binding dehydrogenase [Streptomyces fungicidicus]|uniref:zinc-binding dehydrogenase n=1 Tax=Streptomyces fungicidicus TaxID=68203 RepID=UPI00381C05B8